MIPVSDLVRAADEFQAVTISARNPDFSIIPISNDGKLTSYFERDDRLAKDITLDDLISDATSHLELVEF